MNQIMTRRDGLLAALGLAFAATPVAMPAFAQAAPSPEAIAARLTALGVRVRNQPVAAGDLAQLQSIMIHGTGAAQMTDDDCALLPHLPQLSMVQISTAPQLTGAGVAHIARIRSLRTFVMVGMRIGDAAAQAIASAGSVATLRLQDMQLTNAGLPHLRRMEGVSDLDISGNAALTDAGIAALEGHPGLQALRLMSSAGITDAALRPVGTLRKLRRLHLNNTPITGAGFEHLVDLPELQELGLLMTRVNDAAAVHLGKLTKLRSLYAWQTQLTDAAMPAIAQLTALETLYLEKLPITDAGLAALTTLVNLRTLWLSGTNVTDAGIAAIAALPKLSGVQVAQTTVGDAGILALARNPQMTNVQARQSRVTAAGVEAAMAAPGRNARLVIRI